MGDCIDVELEDRKAFLRQLIGGGHLGRPARAVQFCADRTRYRAERVYLVGGVA
jgi:hypothetical protein